jgi:hypothetical protein
VYACVFAVDNILTPAPVAEIKGRNPERLRHVIRMDQTWWLREIFDSTPEGRIKIRRPSLR